MIFGWSKTKNGGCKEFHLKTELQMAEKAGEKRGSGFISIHGSIQHVLNCRCGGELIGEFSVDERGHSLGLGARPGEENILGEVFTWNGEILSYVPTDGTRNNRVYFGGETKFITPFNISVGGGPAMDLEPAADFKTLAAIYEEVLARAESRENYGGLVGVAFSAFIEDLHGSEVTQCPSPANAFGGKLTDPEVKDQWFVFDQLSGGVLYAVGVAMAPEAAQKNFDQELLDRMFYVNPGAKVQSPFMSHTHGLRAPQSLEQTGRDPALYSMRHVLEQSTLKLIGGSVYIIERIEAGD